MHGAAWLTMHLNWPFDTNGDTAPISWYSGHAKSPIFKIGRSIIYVENIHDSNSIVYFIFTLRTIGIILIYDLWFKFIARSFIASHYLSFLTGSATRTC
jgi:hypothetical protein